MQHFTIPTVFSHTISKHDQQQCEEQKIFLLLNWNLDWLKNLCKTWKSTIIQSFIHSFYISTTIWISYEVSDIASGTRNKAPNKLKILSSLSLNSLKCRKKILTHTQILNEQGVETRIHKTRTLRLKPDSTTHNSQKSEFNTVYI